MWSRCHISKQVRTTGSQRNSFVSASGYLSSLELVIRRPRSGIWSLGVPEGTLDPRPQTRELSLSLEGIRCEDMERVMWNIPCPIHICIACCPVLVARLLRVIYVINGNYKMIEKVLNWFLLTCETLKFQHN